MESLFNLITDYLIFYFGLESDSVFISIANALLLGFSSILFYFLVKGSVIRLIRNFIIKITWGFGSYLIKHKLFTNAFLYLPIALIFNFVDIVSHSDIERFLLVACQLLLVFISGNLIFSVLNALLDILAHKGVTKKLPVKSLTQLGKVITVLVCGIVTVSYLMGKSPAYLLGSLGALSAVLMLVFKDSILGLVSGIQLTANRMVSLGDWIELGDKADGEVIDISLTTVSIRNWDNTITTLPAYELVSKAMKNWSAMYSKGRRIKRSIYIDISSISFISEDEISELSRFDSLKEYLNLKNIELNDHNKDFCNARKVNRRQLTNIGTFRVFLENFLKSHSDISDTETLLVRQLQATDKGLPIEIYAFTKNTSWLHYEKVQADIFDYIYSVLPLFDLSVYQLPTGLDFKNN